MTDIFLESMAGSIKYATLPPSWNTFNLQRFSDKKSLWDYQQDAVKNSIKALFKFHEIDSNLKVTTSSNRKRLFFKFYEDFGLNEDLDFNLNKIKNNIIEILEDYYPILNEKISYENFINRMSFWMATGSGKTIIIIKLIEILKNLIDLGEIPAKDVLFLTCRDDLLHQFATLVDEFNQGKNGIYIDLKSLKSFPQIKREKIQNPRNKITVFYYRSDNLSDQQKEKILDFRNYDNDGNWYVFLDEAHKGDKEESKRQFIFSILSRNGFLFNSSATFTDPRDIITCVFEFNLSSFINSGYGKHLLIFNQEFRAFKEKEDFNAEEKEKIVLKSLILFTYINKSHEELQKIRNDLYHKPLLLTLVNSVNIKDADLKLFFRVLKKIGNKNIKKVTFTESLTELWNELKSSPKYLLETNEKIKINEQLLISIDLDDILKYVYNSEKKGGIEVLRCATNKKELAFKLKTSETPFALIKIGDISNWINDELKGYEIQSRLLDEAYFENLNDDDSEIKILMGSRSFYEGWDSNRPNVINYINIGVGKKARKFILQSSGRGIRIEPIKNVRKRLLASLNSGLIEPKLAEKLKGKVSPIETLFIFGTNRNSLSKVIETLKVEKIKKRWIKNHEEFKNEVKKEDDNPILFEISDDEFNRLKKYVDFISDERIFLMKYNTDLKRIKLFRRSLNTREYLKFNGKKYWNLDLLIQKIFDFYENVD
ncbi:MAG: DEAD/DEAH box helicase family protein [Candidatus Helarchaeota archaeon]